MLEPDLRADRIVWTGVATLALLGAATGVAFALLGAWRLAPGDEPGSAAVVEAIPQPRLQTAPQLERGAVPMLVVPVSTSRSPPTPALDRLPRSAPQLRGAAPPTREPR